MSRIAILTPDPVDALQWGELPREVYERMAGPLLEAGLEVQAEPWTLAPAERLAGYDLVLPILIWGYHFDLARFQARIEAWAAAGVRLRNPVSVLRWNAEKRYLDALAARGAPIIPTLFVDRLEPAHVAAAAERFGSERLVVKPQVSGAAWKTVKLKPGDPLDGAPEVDAMIQPFLPSVAEEGELSLLFFERRFSHAIRKQATGGDFRVQEQFGGLNSPLQPEPEALAAAEQVLAAIDEPLLYARIDLIRGLDGKWALIEIELIEPDLFLSYEREGVARFVEAVRAAASAETV